MKALTLKDGAGPETPYHIGDYMDASARAKWTGEAVRKVAVYTGWDAIMTAESRIPLSLVIARFNRAAEDLGLLTEEIPNQSPSAPADAGEEKSK